MQKRLAVVFVGVAALICFNNQAHLLAQGSGPPRFDVNRDGRLDLLWQHQMDGRLAVWTMDGPKQIAGMALSPSGVPDTSWKVVGTGDLDGDGWSDIAWQNIVDGRVAAWLMVSTFVKEASLLSIPQVSDLNWRIAGVGDFTGDGRADLVWWNEWVGRLGNGQQVAVWVMDGFRVVSADRIDLHNYVAPGSNPNAYMDLVGCGDFDGDGKPDLVFNKPSTEEIILYFVDRLQWKGPWDGWSYVPTYENLDPSWKLRAVADLDGDGNSDFIWQHDTSGLLGVWFEHGIWRRSGELLSPHAVLDLGWRIVGPK